MRPIRTLAGSSTIQDMVRPPLPFWPEDSCSRCSRRLPAASTWGSPASRGGADTHCDVRGTAIDQCLCRSNGYLLSLQGDPDTAIDVVSMSMGGVASDAWADVVNRSYEAGLCLVTAAGNNFGRPKSIVFPARFRRVLAACGVMADFRPYELEFGQMSGNYGPDSKMDTAIAAFTPNIPWAEIGAPDVIDWDGQGTSSATPQVAAAAALWLQRYKAASQAGRDGRRSRSSAMHCSSPRMRPNPRARPTSAEVSSKHTTRFALSQLPLDRQTLRKQAADSAAFAFWRLLRGTAVAAAPRIATRSHVRTGVGAIDPP